MRTLFGWGGIAPGLFAALVMIAGGCADNGEPGRSKSRGGVQIADARKGQSADEKTAHSGWWCDEHGIPEAECSMCSAKVAKEFKAKGDWCDKHDRALSQCFICNPDRREFYAAKYRAKYGKEPPPIEDDEIGGAERKDVKK
jgi:hypothetical protein